MNEQCHSSICSRITHLFNNEMFSDVKFISKDGSVVFYGHKLLLALKSSVFADEFYGGTLKKKDVLPVSDAHSSVFHKMLQFIYTEDIEFESIQEAHDLSVIAKDYDISTLEAECQSFINKRIVSPELVCKIFETAKSPQLQFKHVENLCHEAFVRQTKSIFQSKRFLEASMSTVAAILDNTALDIDSEMDVLQAVLKWGKSQCCHQYQPTTDSNLRLHIEPLLKYVRFLTLSLHDLQNFFGTYNVLNAVEVCALITAKLQPNSDILLPEILCSQTQSRSLSSKQDNVDEDEKFYDCEDSLPTIPNTTSRKFGLLSSGKDASLREFEVIENRVLEINKNTNCMTEVTEIVNCAYEVAENDNCATEVTENTNCVTEVTENTNCMSEVTEIANCATEVAKNANCVTEVTENANCVMEVTKNANCVINVTENSSCMTTDTNYANGFEKGYPLNSTKDSGEEEQFLKGATCQSIGSDADLLKDNSNALFVVQNFDEGARRRSLSAPVSMSSSNCFGNSNEANSEFFPKNLQDMSRVGYICKWRKKFGSPEKSECSTEKEIPELKKSSIYLGALSK